LRVTITSTLVASVTTQGVLQDFIVGGELEITDLNGFYNSPTTGTFTLKGQTTTLFPTFGYSLQIEVQGADPIPTITSEPAMLAVIGGGLLAVGVARARRRHA
jgi:hypothetical protein